METFIDNLPLLLPFIIIELLLAITALIHVLRHRSYRFGNIWMWCFVVTLLQFIGPIVYFAFGRGDDE